MHFYVIVSLVAFISYGGLLTLVFHHGVKENRSRQLFSLYLFDMLLMEIVYLMVSLSGTARQAHLWYTLAIPIASGQFVLYFLFTHAFLGYERLNKSSRIGVFVWFLVAVFGMLFSQRFVFVDVYRSQVTGLFIPEFGPLIPVLSLPVVWFAGSSIFYLVTKHRSSPSPVQRVRIRYLLLGVAVVWAGVLANASPALRAYPVDVLANIVGASVIAYAILRHRLFDINVIIREGLLYAISAMMMGTVYFLTIYIASRILPVLTDLELFVLSLTVAVITAIVAQPVRDHLQRWIDRTFFRGKYNSSLMLQRLSQKATSVLDLKKLADMIIDDVIQTMYIQWAVLLLEQDQLDSFQLITQRGLDTTVDLSIARDHPTLDWISHHEQTLATENLEQALGQDVRYDQQLAELRELSVALFIPLRARDNLIGVLLVGPRRSRQRYSQDDKLTLETLSNQVAVAVDNARLYDAVQRQIAERIKTEREREALIVELEAKNTELERFTYTVSHDLKSPLITIKGFLGFLERDATCGEPDRLKRDIELIADATDKMQQLLDELLELSRIGRLVNPPQDISMSDLVREAVGLVAGLLNARGVQVDIASDMPIVCGDRPRLRQVFENLLGNAAKFMGDQPQPRIELGARQDGEQAVFYVRDNGIGIEPQYQEQVFGLFEKIEVGSEGTGIGLAIVKRVVDTHGGRVWVESDGTGQGSTFCFTVHEDHSRIEQETCVS